MAQTDHKLGLQIRDHLIAKGVETPMTDKVNRFSIDKKAAIAALFQSIMELLGLDVTDDSLADTPDRVAKMYVDEIFYGLDYARFPKATVVENKMCYDEMVLERNISVQSNCEHHFVIISGKAFVAYIPKVQGQVLGLSKLNRIVEFFAKRPQIQERLTAQVYHALQFILKTDDIAVVIKAEHYCVKSRGVRDEQSDTVTSKLGGIFQTNPNTRAEFMAFVNAPKG